MKFNEDLMAFVGDDRRQTALQLQSVAILEGWRMGTIGRWFADLFTVAERLSHDVVRSHLAPIFETDAWLPDLIEQLIQPMFVDPFAIPVLHGLFGPVSEGLMLYDSPHFSLSLSVLDFQKPRKIENLVNFSTGLACYKFLTGVPGKADIFCLEVGSSSDDRHCVKSPCISLSADDIVTIDQSKEAICFTGLKSDAVVLCLLIKGSDTDVRIFETESGKLRHISSSNEQKARSHMMIELLAMLGKKDAAPQFLEAVQSPYFDLRWNAMRQWLALDLPAAAPYLRDMAKNDPNDEVRHLAQETQNIVDKMCRECRS